MKPLNYRISPLFKNVFSFEGCCTEKNRKSIRKKGRQCTKNFEKQFHHLFSLWSNFFFLRSYLKILGPSKKKRGDFPEVGGVTFRDGGCFSRLKYFFFFGDIAKKKKMFSRKRGESRRGSDKVVSCNSDGSHWGSPTSHPDCALASELSVGYQIKTSSEVRIPFDSKGKGPFQILAGKLKKHF